MLGRRKHYRYYFKEPARGTFEITEIRNYVIDILELSDKPEFIIKMAQEVVKNEGDVNYILHNMKVNGKDKIFLYLSQLRAIKKEKDQKAKMQA